MVTVLIVSYRRADQVERALDSVARHLPGCAIRVWDNASDGSDDIRRLAARRPEVAWTFSPENIGFAAAVNALMAQLAGDDTAGAATGRTLGAAATPDPEDPFVLLLNPDAVLDSPMTGCLEVLRSQDSVAACAPWLDQGPAHRAWDNAHREPTLLRHICSYAGWSDRLRARGLLSDLYDHQPERVDGYLTGACLWIRRAAWRDVGPFDDRFFLYCEEVDWARRARRRGWQLRAVPEAGARHEAAGTVRDSAAGSRRSAELLARSQVLYLRKHSGALAALAYRGAMAVLDRVQRSKRAGRARSAQASPEIGG